MNQLITNQALTMSSREIAEYTGKKHNHVIRDIKKLYTDLYEDDPSLDYLKNEGVQIKDGIFVDVDTRGYVQYFTLDRKHTDCLLTGYSAKARMVVIERWHELEEKQAPQLPQTMAQALQLAADQAFQLEAQAPKVAFVDKYVHADSGNKTFRQVCKLMNVKENAFRAFLVDEKIMYRLNSEWAAHANHITAGRFATKTGVSEHDHAFNTAYFTPKGVEWVAGQYAKFKLNQEN